MLNHYDFGLYVGWFEIPRDFIGLPELYGLKCENLDGSVIAGIRARFNIKLVKCVFKTKVLFYKISFINL
jgi:hypothetical protein